MEAGPFLFGEMQENSKVESVVAGHTRRAAPHRSSVSSPRDTGDASWRRRSSDFCDSLVLRHGQVPFCRPLDRNWGRRKNHGTYYGRANQSQFMHVTPPNDGIALQTTAPLPNV